MRTDFARKFIAIGALMCTASIGLAFERGGVAQPRGISHEEEIPMGAMPQHEQEYEMSPYFDETSPMYEPMASCSDQCCGDCHHCCQPDYCCRPDYCCPPQKGMFYSETQIMFLRAHVVEESLGKLSEKYEFTPRFILGYESPSNWGARARYWTYGRTTQILGDDDSLRLDFDVIDVEGTTRFSTERADLLLSCGFRWVDAEIEVDDDSVRADMPGITLAADVRTLICRRCRSEWSGVFGARWSLLGTDWEGDDDAFIEPTFDDNVTVQEIYGGVEYLRRYGSCDIYARAVFEVQNWHSDALSDSADTDSIGFVGPGIHVGASF